MTMFSRVLASSLVLVLGCAPSGPVGVLMDTSPRMAEPTPRSKLSAPIRLLEIPVPAGGTVGGHYNGPFKTFQYAIDVSPSLSSTWSRWLTENTATMLRAAGYKVEESSKIFGDMETDSGTTWVLGGRLTSLSYNTYGPTAGYRTVARVGVHWELFDLARREVVASGNYEAEATTTGNSGDAFVHAARNAAAQFIATPRFYEACCK